jgi:hypothetical protein
MYKPQLYGLGLGNVKLDNDLMTGNNRIFSQEREVNDRGLRPKNPVMTTDLSHDT